jgi:hypothetical protein
VWKPLSRDANANLDIESLNWRAERDAELVEACRERTSAGIL